MSRMTWGAALAAVFVAALFLAGFFHGSPSPAFGGPAAPPSPSPSTREVEGWREMADSAPASIPGPKTSLLALTNSPAYKRAADFSLRVADCTQAEDQLEARLESLKGEILEMVMEGTEGSRTCALSVLIPSDHFREFISQLRQMGKVQSERITASRMKPGARAAAPSDPDPRELSLVAIRMADEKIAPVVLESRGILAASFDRSASHFMKGAAVMVEGLGYGLPFIVVVLAAAIPLFLVARIRRSGTSAILKTWREDPKSSP